MPPLQTYSDVKGLKTAVDCKPCPVNTWSTSTGLKASTDCTACGTSGGNNLYSPPGSSLQSACQVCPINFYVAAGGVCTPCVAGRYSAGSVQEITDDAARSL